MKIKYRSGYAEGGFLDDGAAVDPVSGNEVPSGSLAEEVRDDVPAQLSEGEFVVPADVVRYIGLEKLMKMREAAKVGLANMEADGQMGGSPAPIREEPMMNDPMMDDSLEMDELIDGMDSEGFEGAVQQFADGGSVIPTYKDYTGNEFGSPTTVTFSTYINAAGDKITIPTLRGKPLRPVPEGYTLVVPVSDGGTEEGGGKVDPVETAPVDSGDHRPTDGTAAMTRDYKKNMGPSGYQADLTRSTIIRNKRINALDAMIKPNMDQEATDLMFAAMTPQAQDLYNSRFKDPKGLDSYFSEGMGVADRFLIAQKTADSMNSNNGAIEQGSQYLPDGRPIEWKKMVGGVVKAFSGGIEIGVLDQFGKLLDKITGEKINTVGTTEPSAVDRPTYNQEYWSNFEGTDAELRAAKRQASLDMSGGLRGGWSIDAYGNKSYKEPGTYDIWDHIADVEANEANTKKIKADRIAAQEKAEADQVETQNAMDKLRADAAEKQKLQDRIAARKNQDRLAIEAAADKADKADRIAASEAQAKKNAAAQRTKSLAQQAAAKAEQARVNKENYRLGGDGEGQRQRDAQKNDAGGTGGGVRSSSGKSGYQGSSIGEAGRYKGGLIKKMRKDPTSGLAAKKKSKAKAQAKKGALAAKRT